MSTGGKPPRLRNSCVECTSAKVGRSSITSDKQSYRACFIRYVAPTYADYANGQVKCSGEKTGCIRCAKLKLDCTYLVSMAGHVPRWQKTSPSTEIKEPRDPRSILPLPREPLQSSVMEGETARLSEVSPSPNPTSRRAENAFSFPLGDLASEGEGVFAVGDNSSSDRYNNYQAGGATSEPQWATFTSDFSVLLHTPDVGLNNINELGMDKLAEYSFGSSGSLTPDQANLGSASHGSSPPHRRWSNVIKPLGVQGPPGVQGVLMTTQIINIVEDSLANKSQSLEMLLGTIQKAGVALNGLIGLHHHSDNQRCLMLFPVVLHQVAELMEVGVESLDALNWQTAAEMSGTAASNSILERLDSLNDLISSYHPATTSPHRDEDKVRRWTRRLEEGLDASLMTVGRLMELDRACRTRGGHEHVRQNVGGCAHLEILAERFHLLRRRLSG